MIIHDIIAFKFTFAFTLKEKFLEILRTTKQNVFVLAAENGDQRHAMTVSSVFSVSLEPMSMAVSVNQRCKSS